MGLSYDSYDCVKKLAFSSEVWFIEEISII